MLLPPFDIGSHEVAQHLSGRLVLGFRSALEFSLELGIDAKVEAFFLRVMTDPRHGCVSRGGCIMHLHNTVVICAFQPDYCQASHPSRRWATAGRSGW